MTTMTNVEQDTRVVIETSPIDLLHETYRISEVPKLCVVDFIRIDKVNPRVYADIHFSALLDTTQKSRYVIQENRLDILQSNMIRVAQEIADNNIRNKTTIRSMMLKAIKDLCSYEIKRMK